MTNKPDIDEARMRDSFLARTLDADASDPAAEAQAIHETTARARAETGARDVVLLAVASFFALLMMVVAPLAKSTLDMKINSSNTREPPDS